MASMLVWRYYHRLVLAAILLVVDALDFHPLLSQGEPGAPGIKSRILSNGLRYLNRVAANIVADQLPKLRIPNVQHQMPNGQGQLRMSNIRISRFKRADYQTITPRPPNIVGWSMSNMNIGLIGNLGGQLNILVPLVLEGQVEILAEDISFHLDSALEQSVTGGPQIIARSCRTTIGRMQIINHNGGFVGIAVNMFQAAVADNIRPLLQQVICDRVHRFINVDLNEKLSATPSKSPLSAATEMSIFNLALKKGEQSPINGAIVPIIRSHRSKRQSSSVLRRTVVTVAAVNNKQRKKKEKTKMVHSSKVHSVASATRHTSADVSSKLNLTELFGPGAGDKLYIDYRITSTPVCSFDSIQVTNAGEISYLGEGKTPFYADKLAWPKATDNNDNMLQMLISDYLPNSLLYHAYKQRMLRFRLDPNTPHLGVFLSTKCNTSALDVCIGDLLPQLAKQYPDSRVELVFSAVRAPAMLFSEKNGGVISININGVVLVYVQLAQSKLRQVAVFDLDVVADTKVKVLPNRVTGSITLHRFHLSSKYGSVALSESDLSDLGLLSAQILQNVVNELLAEGLPIPVPPVIRLVNPEVAIYNRRLWIGTNIRVDEHQLGDLAVQAIDSRTF